VIALDDEIVLMVMAVSWTLVNTKVRSRIRHHA
jgi:hypothetical protein